MQCEKCGSENTQRLQVAFEGGTQDISARSHTAGVGSLSGSLGIGGSVTKTSGTTQSVLAQKAAPPKKKSYKWPAIGLIAGLLFFGNPGTVVVGFAFIAAGGYFGYVAFKFNRERWPALYRNWLDSWICHKCGHIYHQASSVN